MDLWTLRELPVLDAIAQGEAEGVDMVNFQDLVTVLKMDPQAVARSLEALVDAGYVTLVDCSSMVGFDALDIRLMERGRRATGQWPSDDPFDALVQVIEARSVDSGTDELTRTKLRGLLDDLQDVGKATATAVLSAYLQRVVGI
jgi:DNA-binding transcriptional ArsR family regulator